MVIVVSVGSPLPPCRSSAEQATVCFEYDRGLKLSAASDVIHVDRRDITASNMMEEEERFNNRRLRQNHK